jgi:hypothetical protein
LRLLNAKKPDPATIATKVATISNSALAPVAASFAVGAVAAGAVAAGAVIGLGGV